MLREEDDCEELERYQGKAKLRNSLSRDTKLSQPQLENALRRREGSVGGEQDDDPYVHPR